MAIHCWNQLSKESVVLMRLFWFYIRKSKEHNLMDYLATAWCPAWIKSIFVRCRYYTTRNTHWQKRWNLKVRQMWRWLSIASASYTTGTVSCYPSIVNHSGYTQANSTCCLLPKSNTIEKQVMLLVMFGLGYSVFWQLEYWEGELKTASWISLFKS